jgi:hypothetical protein
VIPCTGHRAKHCAINIKKLIALRKEFGSSSWFTGRNSLVRLLVYNFMTFVFAVETAVTNFGLAADIRWHISVALPVKNLCAVNMLSLYNKMHYSRQETIFHI